MKLAPDLRYNLVMAKYTVYYTHDTMSGFRPPTKFEEGDYDRVAEVEASDLEDLFRKMNVVDGTELPVQLKVRSMCMGDVALDSQGQYWFCGMVGWKQLAW